MNLRIANRKADKQDYMESQKEVKGVMMRTMNDFNQRNMINCIRLQKAENERKEALKWHSLDTSKTKVGASLEVPRGKSLLESCMRVSNNENEYYNSDKV